jgi:uncharacterized protein YodC (DUF2158 family)
MKNMEVLAIGSEVAIAGDIPATIIAFEVRGTVGLITYQCCWWDERTRRSEWLTEAEVVPKENKKSTVRFK